MFTSSALAESPFKLTVVPSSSKPPTQGITIAKDKPREFYVILTNESKDAQAVFEYWNSWGYQNVSFQFTTEAGEKFTASKRSQFFTVNFPSTFLIMPGEHLFYPIKLDQEWEIKPDFKKEGETKISLKAIYQVTATPEATEHKVWLGRVESKVYELTVRHW